MTTAIRKLLEPLLEFKINPRAALLPVVAFGLVEFVLTAYGPALVVSDAGVIPRWPPAGSIIVGLLATRGRCWPGALLGAWCGLFVFFGNVASGNVLIAATSVISVGLVLQAVIAASLVRRYVDLKHAFSKAHHSIALFGISIGSCLGGSLLSAWTLCILGLTPWDLYWFVFGKFLAGCTLSIVHLLPAYFLWCRGIELRYSRRRLFELLALFVLTVLTTLAIFTDLLLPNPIVAQLYLVFPLVLWAVFRFSPKEMIVLLSLMTAITIYASFRNTGPFASSDLELSLLNALVYIGFGVMVAMTLSTISAQRKSAEFSLRRLNGTLERRVEERTEALKAANDKLVKEIIERQRAEREIIANKHRKTAIIETALDCIVSIRSDGTIADFNSAAEETFGYSKDDIKEHSFVSLISAAECEKACAQGIEHYLKEESAPIFGRRVEIFCRRADQTEFPVELAMIPVDDETGPLYICYVRDLTAQKQAQQEQDRLNRDLLCASHRAGMAEVASGVLHNVGNVLNSVNVSAAIVAEKVKNSRVAGLAQAVRMLHDNRKDLAEFLTEEDRGRAMLNYLGALSDQLESDRKLILDEFSSVNQNVQHIKEIISRQQSYASHNAAVEPVDICCLIDEVIAMQVTDKLDIAVLKSYGDIAPLLLDKHGVLQILINLVQNAKDALAVRESGGREMVVRACVLDDTEVRIDIQDNGVGIARDDLQQVFHYAYTTKKHGHGFGLHASAAAARNMQGDLRVESEGPGKGALFVLTLPFNPAQAHADG